MSELHEHPLLKLVLELEDIITSADIQPVYFKLVHKITTATIFHYTRYCNFKYTYLNFKRLNSEFEFNLGHHMFKIGIVVNMLEC